MEYNKEYYRDASKRHYCKMNGLPYQPTELQVERAKESRNRWYAISSLLIDWQEKEYSSNEFARELGFPTAETMYMYLLRNGETLKKKYGGLPRVNTPSKVLKKYMEDEDGLKA